MDFINNIGDWFTFWGLVELVLGIMLGLLVVVVIFMVTTPLYVHSLVNKPNPGDQPGPSNFHMFTFPEEGKVKIIVRGDRVIRMIMLFGNHTFARVGTRSQPEYWEIKSSVGNDENPLTDIIWFLYPWASYVYAITGAVFTGISPWQTVHEYPIERTKIHRNEKGAGEDKNIVLDVKEDMSDHFRAREFLYPIRIAAADTKDKISVNVLLVIKAYVKNPFNAAYGTTRWDSQLVNLVTNVVTNYTRVHNLEDVLSAKDSESAKGLNAAVEKIIEDEKNYGVQIVGVDIIDISPNLSPEEKTRLYAEALARAEGEATRIGGQAKADAVKYMQDVVTGGGAAALAVLQSENFVKAAQAAGSGAVVMTAPGASAPDPTLTAILAELRRNRNQGGVS